MRNIKLLFFVLLCLNLLQKTEAESFPEKKLIILSSNEPSLTMGLRLSESTSIRLSKSQVVRVMADSGEVYKVDGPFDGLLSEVINEQYPPLSFFDKVFDLVDGSESLETNADSDRPKEQQSPPRFWEERILVETGSHSSVCITPSQSLSLKRQKNTTGEILTIKAGTKPSEVKRWPGDEGLFNLDRSILMPAPEKIKFMVGEQGHYTSVRVSYGEEPDNPGKQLMWFTENQCEQQVRAAISYYQTF